MISAIMCDRCGEPIKEDDKYTVMHRIEHGILTHVVTHAACDSHQDSPPTVPPKREAF